MSLIQMSIGGGALILFTVLVRSVALDKLPKKMFFILWGVAVLQLLLSSQRRAAGSWRL